MQWKLSDFWEGNFHFWTSIATKQFFATSKPNKHLPNPTTLSPRIPSNVSLFSSLNFARYLLRVDKVKVKMMRSHEPSNNIFRKSRIRRTPSHFLRVYLCGIVIYSSMRRGGLAMLRIWVSEERKTRRRRMKLFSFTLHCTVFDVFDCRWETAVWGCWRLTWCLGV